jgi:NAD(P)-dependent dehydrogenase (short-subunit alcohol dehydrogenase family)
MYTNTQCTHMIKWILTWILKLYMKSNIPCVTKYYWQPKGVILQNLFTSSLFKGSIVMVSSVASIHTQEGAGVYGMGKSAIDGMVR